VEAEVVELVDTQDLKSCEPKSSYGFDSRPRYQSLIINRLSGIFVCGASGFTNLLNLATVQDEQPKQMRTEVCFSHENI
jgi:hypothetical protein